MQHTARQFAWLSTLDDCVAVLGRVQALRFAPALRAPPAAWTQPARGKLGHERRWPFRVGWQQHDPHVVNPRNPRPGILIRVIHEILVPGSLIRVIRAIRVPGSLIRVIRVYSWLNQRHQIRGFRD